MARPGNLRAAAAGLRAPLLPPTTVSRLLLLLLLVQSSAAETPAGWEDVIEDPLEDSEADGTLRPLTTLVRGTPAQAIPERIVQNVCKVCQT